MDDALRGEASRCLCLNLPLMEYEAAWRLQTRLVEARKAQRLASDVVMVLEHPPVFTLGRRGGRDNLTVAETFLQQKNVAVVQVERGGDITYHGPGQLIVYVIMDLAARRLAVVDFVTLLEEVMIQTAGEWGVSAARNPLNRGVWVGPRKLGSVGIAIRKGISFHGLALNVRTELEPFTWINPCGLQHVDVTSLVQESGQDIPMADARRTVRERIEAVFDLELASIGLRDLQASMGAETF